MAGDERHRAVPIPHVVERIGWSFALPAEAIPALTGTALSSPVPAVLFSILTPEEAPLEFLVIDGADRPTSQ
jgi:hypothetical protein